MRTYREYVSGRMADSDEALEYLKASLELYETDKDLDAFLVAVRTVADARGGLSKIAKETNLNRQHLYRSLAKNGNPTIKTLDSILHTLGLKLSIEKAS
ncbi:MAG: transcriptional regulator [Spirochaetales bacterium]|nr:transcriptional regulator [Spirochaetales bacterium]